MGVTYIGVWLTRTGGSHWLDTDLLVLQDTGVFLWVEQCSGGELVDLIRGGRELWDARLNHLLDRLTRGALEL